MAIVLKGSEYKNNILGAGFHCTEFVLEHLLPGARCLLVFVHFTGHRLQRVDACMPFNASVSNSKADL